jgi:hypothetical protein
LAVRQPSRIADRAVTTTAVIDGLSHGPFLQSEDGRRSFTVYATVRYEVDGTLTQSRVVLSGCRGGACPARHRRGDPITVAYDPQQVTSVDLASRVIGRHPLLDPWVLALVLMGVSFLVPRQSTWCGVPDLSDRYLSPGAPDPPCRQRL